MVEPSAGHAAARSIARKTGAAVNRLPDPEAVKAHYVCLNIECRATLDELEHSFRRNDAVLRHLVIKTTAPRPPLDHDEVTARKLRKRRLAAAAQAE